MNKVDRIYLHKEDVWTEGEHWMSSASRDIFEHFYKAIRNTFIDRYQNPRLLELAEQIVHQRKWASQCYGLIADAAQNKTNLLLPPYILGREQFPVELEYIRNQDAIMQTEQDFDPVIYPNFEKFFTEANHGYGQGLDSRKIIYDLYFNFMKPYSEEQLFAQLTQEHQESIDFLNEMLQDLQAFNKQTKYTKFHQFALKNKR